MIYEGILWKSAIDSKICRKKKDKTHRTIFSEYYRHLTQRERERERAGIMDEIFAEYGNSWPSLNFL